MLKSKLKKLACITLAVSMVFSNVSMSVKAKVVDGSDYSAGDENEKAGFANAVRDFYKTDKNEYGLYDQYQVNGDFEIACFTDNYEYSIVKDGDARQKYEKGDTVNGTQAKASCIWEKGKVVTFDKDNKYCYEMLGVEEITYLGEYSGKAKSSPGSETSIEWVYDLVLVRSNANNAHHEPTFNYYAVNMKPRNRDVSIDTLTLPAYIAVKLKNDLDTTCVKCIEVGDAAFLSNSHISNINIPDTYQRICAYAFTGCSNLKTVKFVKTASTGSAENGTIDCYEIKSQNDLSSDDILKSSDLHFVGAGAFAGCNKLTTEVKFPTILTEGYRYIDEKDGDQGYAAVETTIENGAIKRSYKTSGLVLNEDVKSITSQEFSKTIKKKALDSENQNDILRPYFMGQGVFRDCYSLETVTIDGVNPFIPANTYAGCSKISKVEIKDSVQNIYFGPACFAGADGTTNLEKASSLTELNLNSKNLQNVFIGAYAFKNCRKLQNVNITADINTQDGIYSKVQGTELHSERAFENSFTKEVNSCFSYEPKSSSQFIISEGFFQGSKVQEFNFGGKLKYNESTSDKSTSTVIVEDYAFTDIDCNSIKLCANQIELYTGALFSVGSSSTSGSVEITISGNTLIYKGEPFANTKHSNKTNSEKNSKLSKLIIDSKEVKFWNDSMKEIVPIGNNVTGYKDTEKTVSINSSFYGLPKNMKIIFTDNVQKLSGSLESMKRTYYYYNERKKDKNFDPSNMTSLDLDHKVFGDLDNNSGARICFQGCELKDGESLFSIPGSDISDNEQYSDKGKAQLLLYADCQTNEYLLGKVKEKENLSDTIKPYTQSIVHIGDETTINMVKDVNGIPSIAHGLKYKKFYVKYADQTEYSEKIGYSEEEQKEYNDAMDAEKKYLGINGFIVSSDFTIFEKDEPTINAQLQYRGQTIQSPVMFIPKVPTTITASAVKGTEFVAGTEPKLSDFGIDHVLYNDETKDANIKFGEINENSDLSLGQFDVSVVTESGINTYQLGKNTVKITYTDSKNNVECSSTCIVTAEAPKVATMSAVLSGNKKAYYEGDILTAKDFNITAEYNDEKTIDAYYAKSTDKYTINPEILPTMDPTDDSVVTTVTLIDENGASTTVDINVNKVKPLYLEISDLPDDVEIGNELKKEDFEVVLHYNNNKTKTLEPDEFEIRYGTLKVDHQNNVHVIYTYNGQSITETVMVKVVEAPVEVTEVPATEAPVEVTEAPVEVTEAPAATTETPATEVPNTITDTETTAAPTATEGTTPATTESPATVVPTATEAPTATASTTPATAVPTATASVTPAPAATTIVQGPNPSSMTGQLDGSVTKATIGVGEKIAILNLASVTYTSSDSNILAVNNNIVTGKKVGKATVTIADANGNTKIYSITVKKAPKKIKASSKKVLKKGKTAKIKVLFQKGCYSYTNTFKSSNKKVATVDKTGVVTAKAKGSCKITVKTYNNKKATIKITVK